MKNNRSQPKNILQVEENKIVEFKRAKIKQSLLTFGLFYRVKSLKWQIIFTLIIAILFAFFQYIIVQITGLYEMGIAAISQSIARLSFQLIPQGENNFIIYNSIFWLLNLFANIPLFILSWKFIGKRFTLLNFIFIGTVSIVGLIISNLITNNDHLYIFGHLNEHELITWENGKFSDFSIIFYALLWGAIQAVCTAILLIIDSSSGGFDILSVYLSHKKFKNVGPLLMLLHLFSFLLSYFVGSYITNGLETGNWKLQNFFSPAFVAGLLMVLFNGWFLNILFPKFQMVKVEIISQKPWAIINAVNQLKEYRFATSVNEVKGGYTKETQNIIVTTCLFIDAAKFIEVARQIDQNAFISIANLKKVDGYLYITNIQYKSLFKKQK
ncbi:MULTISPECIES: YitT family protein [unclassified Mycoplasma]|uniref:YitT family protein n=1 Tax=unclassified Mycoplasma TaxID=2683645 RepID=UPI00211D0C6D|nr:MULTISPECIES: YitT family protein [unclassified Mycoplasma]UUM19736.1 YitT family protein [Mycoplasma sp. 1578d]UUM24720.1 YitT family protein [Mycoplasma sp. 3686d]